MQVTAVRIVPFDTQWLKNEKDQILEHRYCIEATPDENLIQEFQNYPHYQIDQAQCVRVVNNEPNAVTNEGLPALIVCGDHNLKVVLNCFCENDIPAYRMFLVLSSR